MFPVSWPYLLRRHLFAVLTIACIQNSVSWPIILLIQSTKIWCKLKQFHRSMQRLGLWMPSFSVIKIITGSRPSEAPRDMSQRGWSREAAAVKGCSHTESGGIFITRSWFLGSCMYDLPVSQSGKSRYRDFQERWDVWTISLYGNYGMIK